MTPAQKAIATERRRAAAQRLVKKFMLVWIAEGLVPYSALTQEFRPWTETKHRIDFVQLGTKVAIEIEGGIWSGGRHTRGAGFEADAEKYNRLTMEGWAVIRLTSSMLTCKTVSQVQNFIMTRKVQLVD